MNLFDCLYKFVCPDLKERLFMPQNGYSTYKQIQTYYINRLLIDREIDRQTDRKIASKRYMGGHNVIGLYQATYDIV